jgi:hypothetical protein
MLMNGNDGRVVTGEEAQMDDEWKVERSADEISNVFVDRLPLNLFFALCFSETNGFPDSKI